LSFVGAFPGCFVFEGFFRFGAEDFFVVDVDEFFDKLSSGPVGCGVEVFLGGGVVGIADADEEVGIVGRAIRVGVGESDGGGSSGFGRVGEGECVEVRLPLELPEVF
jgi:hypothetical protein